MSGGMIMALPKDLAAELIEEGTSVRSFTTRGPSAGDVVELALNAVTTGSDLVTVATAAVAMPAFVRRLRGYLRRKSGEAGSSTGVDMLVVRSDGRELAIELPDSLSDDEAHEVLVAGIVKIRAGGGT